jgi:hypothetical protein
MSACDQDNTKPSEASPNDWPVISTMQNMDQTITVQIRKADGTGITNTLDPVPNTDPSGSVNYDSMEHGFSAKLWMKQHPKDIQIVDVDAVYKGNGVFKIFFSTANTRQPGLFIGDLIIFDTTGNIVYTTKCYVEVVFNTTDYSDLNEPLTIAEMRLAIRDNCAENNYLLDDYEFTNLEIAHCIRRPVDMFNDTPPRIVTYTMSNFPFRYQWMEATIGFLLKLAAHRYRRNDLQYSAGGVNVADQAKGPAYDQAGDARIQEYKQWMRDLKISQNIDNGFGGFSGRWNFN